MSPTGGRPLVRATHFLPTTPSNRCTLQSLAHRHSGSHRSPPPLPAARRRAQAPAPAYSRTARRCSRLCSRGLSTTARRCPSFRPPRLASPPLPTPYPHPTHPYQQSTHTLPTPYPHSTQVPGCDIDLLYPYDQLCESPTVAKPAPPWNDRIATAFWRGSSTGRGTYRRKGSKRMAAQRRRGGRRRALWTDGEEARVPVNHRYRIVRELWVRFKRTFEPSLLPAGALSRVLSPLPRSV